MKTKIWFAMAIILVFLPIMAQNSRASAASLSLISGGNDYKVGEKFKLVIFLDPNGQTVDTVRANLKYPAELIKIQSFYKNTNFTVSAPGNDFNNQTGDFSFGAGIPGGINQSGPFGYIDFVVEKAGQGTVSINSNSLILGAGQNQFDGQSSGIAFNFTENQISPSPSPQNTAQSLSAETPVSSVSKTSKPSPSPPQKPESSQSSEQVSPSTSPNLAAAIGQNSDESQNQPVQAPINPASQSKIDNIWMAMISVLIAGVIIYSFAASRKTTEEIIKETKINL